MINLLPHEALRLTYSSVSRAKPDNLMVQNTAHVIMTDVIEHNDLLEITICRCEEGALGRLTSQSLQTCIFHPDSHTCTAIWPHLSKQTLAPSTWLFEHAYVVHLPKYTPAADMQISMYSHIIIQHGVSYDDFVHQQHRNRSLPKV